MFIVIAIIKGIGVWNIFPYDRKIILPTISFDKLKYINFISFVKWILT